MAFEFVRSMSVIGLLLLGCGGNVTVEGGGGQGGGSSWDPCANKACGDDCLPCNPDDPSCELPGTITTCDDTGACIIGQATCNAGCTDSDCEFGSEWCIGGECGPCDNSAKVCDIVCPFGWMPYERNGCTPCECAPVNQCESDAECGAGGKCYPGAFCFPGCPAGDPTCCQGNVCSQAGCAEPPPIGCLVRGCPAGDSCDTLAGCASSGCGCDGGLWGCNDDCGGGVCVTPL